MRVLFLTRRFFPDVGGVEKHVLEISGELLLRGHQIVVISEASSTFQGKEARNYQSSDQSDTDYIISKYPVKSTQTEFFKASKIKNFQINSGKHDFFAKFRIWANLLPFYKIFLTADVIHAHDVFFWCLPFRILFFWKRFFVTFHGYETNFPPTLGARVVRKISEVLSVGNICVGKYIEKWYGTCADFITYGGVKIQKSKIKVGKIHKKTNILFLGRLEEDNGVKIYLEAFKILKERKFSFEVTFVGDGKIRKKLEKWGKVAGFVQNPSKYLQKSDIILASSYLSMLEGLILKKKIFAVFQNPLKEDYLKLSPFAKFVSISSNGEDLANSIMHSKNKSFQGYLWAKSQTWEKVADTYLRIWRK